MTEENSRGSAFNDLLIETRLDDATVIDEKDNCQLCLGAKGGVKGNENVIHGVVACDYCHAELMGALKKERSADLAEFIAKGLSIAHDIG